MVTTMRVIKRTGEVVGFDELRIRNAILKAVRATRNELPDGVVDRMMDNIREEIASRFVEFFPNVENIQDIVEKHLVREGLYEIAKAYILYRAERQRIRNEAKERAINDAQLGKLTVTKRDGRKALFNFKKIEETVVRCAGGLSSALSPELVVREVIKNIYDEVSTDLISKALIMSATTFTERDPAYSFLAGRLLLHRLYREQLGKFDSDARRDQVYRARFAEGLRAGADGNLFDRRLLDFDLGFLAETLRPERDLSFQYLGLQTLSERYLARQNGKTFELPQSFWMRVAMGLSLEEPDRNGKAVEYYNLLSSLRYVCSTPTLFHAGTARPQLSSCYITTVEDDLGHIFKSLGDNSQLSKWSGGLGNDWTNIRGTGAPIKSTNVESQGVIPFLKIANDVTNAINRSGKRRGATCAYLETWHYDIEEFLDLRKNTGDERRRTHDMNTANWIPDLFMKRMLADGEWTLFSPDEVPDLHHVYGREFERRYVAYEEKARRGEMNLCRTVQARALWRKMLTMLFETGHPWITFKDACNVRSPQDHVGVIHSSNLCTEITLNTSKDETAVCNLGSVNLARHIAGGQLDREKLAETVKTAIRMLDNVIDINYYPTDEARYSNLRHRPIGLGLMGFQDALYQLGLSFESQEALDFADEVMELVSYHAILASAELARERGAYPTYGGSKWDRGIFPFDTLRLLEEERGEPLDVSYVQRLDWTPVREHVRRYGMRNSNTMAIAPTATIANIAGCFPCIEPIYKNIYVKANISGEFTVVNAYLVEDLKRLELWNDEMLERLKYYDGSVQHIPEVPDDLKARYKEAFEIDSVWCLRLTAARGKWIDQSQSHNVFMRGTRGSLLHDVYVNAWRMGLKTTYYLRSLGATQIEKATLDTKYGFTQKREYELPAGTQVPVAAVPPIAVAAVTAPLGAACRLDDPTCEACQ